jgi:hypothetical protein
MKTYIFGAGASMHAGYPLASDLWRAIQRWTIETFPDGHRLRGTIDTMNSEFDASKPFELVLTDLQRRIDAILKTPPTTGEGIEEKVRLVHTRSEIAELIPRYFQSVREQSAELYRLFATTFLSKGDAVVTFNYDMAIDRELQRSGKWSFAMQTFQVARQHKLAR